jgi:hypothetical protein
MMSNVSCTSAANQACNAMAMCLKGQWGQCMCTNGATTGAATMTGAVMTATPAQCGNGKAEGDEQCDGMDLKGMTCATLGMGPATSMLKCNPRCMFDPILCLSGSATANGGTGAAQGGSGARTMTSATGTMTGGKAGSGGSGR